jgi:hypothetical protein
VLRTLIDENLLSPGGTRAGSRGGGAGWRLTDDLAYGGVCCLRPGSKKLYVSYYRKRVYADLLQDGSIRFKDVVYTSPVPCALQMKRTLNPCACSLLPSLERLELRADSLGLVLALCSVHQR